PAVRRLAGRTAAVTAAFAASVPAESGFAGSAARSDWRLVEAAATAAASAVRFAAFAAGPAAAPASHSWLAAMPAGSRPARRCAVLRPLRAEPVPLRDGSLPVGQRRVRAHLPFAAAAPRACVPCFAEAAPMWGWLRPLTAVA